MLLKTLEVGLHVDRNDQLEGGSVGTAQIHPCLRRAPESDSRGNTASQTSILPWQTEMPGIERGVTPEKGIVVKFDGMALRFWPACRTWFCPLGWAETVAFAGTATVAYFLIRW